MTAPKPPSRHEARDGAARRHVLVFDLSVSRGSPAGSCVLAEVLGLADEHDVTVVSAQCDAADHPHVRWLRVPLPSRPLVLRYVAFMVLAPLVHAWHRVCGLRRADWVQTTQGQYGAADIAYAHFCHRAYLRGAWRVSPVTGARRWFRFVNHCFNAWCEARAFRRARLIVVPSRGLGRELAGVYPAFADRIHVLPNPIELDVFRRPAAFDRPGWRARWQLPQAATVFVFVALGDFARKGMGLILPALEQLGAVEPAAWLLVVGGRPGEIEATRRDAGRLGVADRVRFTGMQQDVGPFLWASDALLFPSAYETFSLVTLQAAAAGLPLIVSKGLHGVEEVVADGRTGYVVDRAVPQVEAAMRAVVGDPRRAARMGEGARQAVQAYSKPVFVERWRALYASLAQADAVPVQEAP
jgi:glycosyltransferase involved in cell wall biosynthesis